MIETKDALRKMVCQTAAKAKMATPSKRLSEQELVSYAIATDLMTDQADHPNQPYAPPEEIEAYMIAKYRDKPCKLSDEILAKMGVKRAHVEDKN